MSVFHAQVGSGRRIWGGAHVLRMCRRLRVAPPEPCGGGGVKLLR
jgi:hypothetical protein